MDEVHELRSVEVGRQEEASGFNNVANNSHTGALELLTVMVIDLSHAGFRLDPFGRFLSIKPGDPTLVLLPRLLLLIRSGYAVMEEN